MKLKAIKTFNNTYYTKEHIISETSTGGFKVGNMIIEVQDITEIIYKI